MRGFASVSLVVMGSCALLLTGVSTARAQQPPPRLSTDDIDENAPDSDRSILKKSGADGLAIDQLLRDESKQKDNIYVMSTMHNTRRLIAARKKALERIRSEPDTPVNVPSWAQENPGLLKIVAKSCNNSPDKRDHLDATAPNLCVRIFRSHCYRTLNNTRKTVIDRCPTVYRARGSKAYRIQTTQEDIELLEVKYEKAVDLMNRNAMEQVDGDTRALKAVRAGGDVFVAPTSGSSGDTLRVRAVESK